MARFNYVDKNRLASLLKGPGVYVFKKGKTFFYIGKAANIRERVKNHFQQSGFKDSLFIPKVTKIGYIKTGSEIEALILEAELIKKHQPKFNVLWRDDKNYFFVGITKEDFPRIFITHQPKEQFNNLTIKQFNKPSHIGPFVDGGALKQTLKILRKVFPFRTCKKIPKRPCLWYELGRCPAPCTLLLSLAKQLPKLKERIKQESKRNVKNLIKVLQGKKTQVLRDLKKEMKKFSKAQEFEKAAKRRDQMEALKNILANAQIFQGFVKREIPYWQDIEKKLKKILKTKKKIKRIEGYDVSNIQGLRATGSMVVFENGKPNKSEYRKFKIKITGKPNDVAMLKEVLERRLNHPEWKLPQIMLIDGGIAQLNVAKLTIKQFNNLTIKIIALAKKKNKLYVEDKKKPILLKNLPQEISNLILHVRDEAHRFALRYHRRLESIDFELKS